MIERVQTYVSGQFQWSDSTKYYLFQAFQLSVPSELPEQILLNLIVNIQVSCLDYFNCYY